MKILKVGTPGYMSVGSDAYPVTLVKISKNGHKITVQHDHFAGDVKNGHDYFGTQKWVFSRNERGRLETFRWSEKRQCFCAWGTTYGICRLGKWHAKQDPCF